MRIHTGRVLLPLITLIIIAFIAMKGLIHPGFYTGHDVWHIVARLYHFDQAFRDGQLLPRWSGGLLNGFGYPLFIFSYQLPWWLAEPFVLGGMSIFAAIKIVFMLTYIMSGITMYLWLQEMWGKKAAFVGAILYLFTPYRFANIFVRANLGEAVSFAFFPFIFWSLHRLYKQKYASGIIIGAIGIAAVLLSHVMVVGLFLVPAGLYFVYMMCVISKSYLQKYLLGSIATLALGIGLAAYYLLPAIMYKPMTVFTEMYHGLYKEHFTPLSKLIYSPWGYGALGTNGEMSRQVGVIVWLVVGMSIVVSLWRLIANRREKNAPHIVAVLLLLSFLLSIFMMTKASASVWSFIESFALIDFPWRFLAVTTFCGSVLGGYIVFACKKLQPRLYWLFIVFLIVSAFYTNRNHLKVNQYTNVPLSLYIVSELTTNTDDEYLPKWVSRTFTKETHPRIDTSAHVDKIIQTSRLISFDYVAEKMNLATIHHMYFPGWTFAVDGKKYPVTKTDGGGMKIELPAGQHHALLEFIPTLVMRFGEMLTFVSLFVVVIILKRRHKA